MKFQQNSNKYQTPILIVMLIMILFMIVYTTIVNYRGIWNLLTGLVVGFTVILFMGSFQYRVGYFIEKEILKIYFGIYTYRFQFSEIIKIHLSATKDEIPMMKGDKYIKATTSAKGIRLELKNGNLIFISPKNESLFIETLKEKTIVQ